MRIKSQQKAINRRIYGLFCFCDLNKNNLFHSSGELFGELFLFLFLLTEIDAKRIKSMHCMM
jgi:hypothetical protein